jgi:ribonuclease HII
MATLPKKSLERHLLATRCDAVVGVDEVGMGCLAGPVVVCAVAFDASFFRVRQRGFEGLRDSKLLTASARTRLSAALTAHPLVRHALVAVGPSEIDRLNVYRAARAGMRRALRKLRPPERAHVLVDGPQIIDGIALPQTAIVKGDRTVFAIAAASVLAKAHRDALMTRLSKKYPGYGLERHKGYGTLAHYGALAALGPSPLHRRSFRL